ncbi:type II toxin-antitoxin system RelE/ParE family toxin [Gemmatimonas aurantiaca]|uniref:type II toxin-antitoxin system RelE/ParE family toxin n=1 Tax=Gemmatimonas aurantiaca TaxID=173480 RepID=UPI00301CF57D
MTYRVLYAEQFHEKLNDQLTYFADQGVPESRVSNWLRGLLFQMDSFERNPERYAVAEVESDIEGIELRRLVYGDYLILYHVEENLREVQIYGFRHAARLP